MVVVADGGPVALQDARAQVGRGVQPHLVAGVVEGATDRAEGVHQQPGQIARGVGRQRVLERAGVLAGDDPQLDGRAGGVGHQRGEARRELDDALLGGDLLAQDVAVEAAALVLVVLARLAQLAPDVVEHDGDRRHARVRMVRRHARLAMAPRDEDVPDLAVALEVEQTVPVHPQHRLDLLQRHRGRRVVVAR